jgi:mannan endo-1,4-beta-mannosidase
MKRIIYPLLFAMLLLCVMNARSQTFKSLNYLNSIKGLKTVAGQHNREPNSTPNWSSQQINTVTGKWPALWGGDFLFSSSDVSNRGTMINQAITEWNNKSLISILYHACPPTSGEPCSWSNVTSTLTQTQWDQLVTNGTTLNNTWKQRLDGIAVHLQKLENSGVEVLFRPFHEINGNWFWWAGRGGANGSRKLFEISRDYLINTKGLSNLIFVWNLSDISTTGLTDYRPSNFDIASMDFYYNTPRYSSTKYNAMISASGGKPIAIGECDILPTSAQLSSQPLWTFFMGWSELVFSNNTNAQIQSTYYATNVIIQEEMPGWGSSIPPATNLAYNKAVYASSNENTTTTPNKAVDANGTTRWSSAFADPQYYVVDLGANFNVNRVKINWEGAYGKNYQIQFSTNNSTWTTIRTVTNNTSLTNDLTGLSGTARYVKLYGTARGTVYGYSMFEFEVYGTTGSRMISPENSSVTVQLDVDLLHTYPNPTQGEATILVNLPVSAEVDLNLVGSIGNTTFKIKQGYLSAGVHQFQVETEKYPPGLYYCVLSYRNNRVIKKLMVIRK